MRVSSVCSGGVMRRYVFVAVALTGMSGLPETALAQSRDLRWDPALDISVTVAGAAAWAVNEWVGSAGSRCRWCETNELDVTIRRDLVWEAPDIADRLSDFSALALAPVASIGLDALAASHDRQASHVAEDTVLVAEATVVALDIDSLVKVIASRERPSAYGHRLGATRREDPRREDNRSFFSGHTTEAAALAAAAGTVATLRGYRWAPVVWGVAGSAALLTGYLRIAADRHWFTDVLAALAVGAGVGIVVPCVFHRPEGLDGESPASSAAGVMRIQRAVVSNDRLVSFAFRW